MLSAIVSRYMTTLVTQGNLNNELGVPLTLSRLDGSHKAAVVEMGASRVGDIRYLAEIAKPRSELSLSVRLLIWKGLGPSMA